jgi:hypothetical protein
LDDVVDEFLFGHSLVQWDVVGSEDSVQQLAQVDHPLVLIVGHFLLAWSFLFSDAVGVLLLSDQTAALLVKLGIAVLAFQEVGELEGVVRELFSLGRDLVLLLVVGIGTVAAVVDSLFEGAWQNLA